MRPWAVEQHHELNLATPDANCEVMADLSSLREALRNLIENAVKHTPPGTKVDVTLTPDLDLIVEDDGPAIAEARARGVVRTVPQGTNGGDGAGLGLTIVMQAMELHGGSVEVTTVAKRRHALPSCGCKPCHSLPAHPPNQQRQI